MKRKAVLGIMLTLLFIGILSLTFDIRPVEASGTIYIRAYGSVEGTTYISTVDNITYTFTDNINDSIVVERDNIVVDGAGYTLQGNGSGTGINMTYRSNVTIKNMEIKTFYRGISLYESSNNNTISSNNVTNSYNGIFLWDSNNNTISSNNVTENNYSSIILIYSSNNNTISGNNVTNNYSSINLGESSNNTISGNTVTNNYYSLRLGESSNNNTISGNNITNNDYGIYLWDSSSNVLRDNSIANNTYNFGVSGSNLSHFVNDVDASNTVDGKPVYYWIDEQDKAVPLDAGYVALVNCTNITVENLNLTKNRQGVLLTYTTNTTITKNNVTNNWRGIYLYESSNNIVSGNNVTANNNYGIILVGSSNNTIYHNNFINNTQQVYSTNSINIWDDSYPSGGNYWNDYTDTDLYYGSYQNETGSDGIWDHPYVIDGDNQDNYPIVSEFPSFLILPLFMIATLLAVIVYRRKHSM